MDFATWLNARLDEGGRGAQSKLCRSTGITSATVTAWKTGRSLPSLEHSLSVASYFGMQDEALLSMIGKPEMLREYRRRFTKSGRPAQADHESEEAHRKLQVILDRGGREKVAALAVLDGLIRTLPEPGEGKPKTRTELRN